MYYEHFEKLCKERNTNASQVSKATGIATATLTNWKHGNYTPKQDKLQKIADYFNVPVDYLMTGEHPTSGYYFDERTAEIAEAIANNKELGGLFDAARNATPEDLQTVQTLLEALKKKGE